MNFLAHAWLAGDDAALQIGGVVGDFVKGLLPAGLPPAIAAGVRLHRHIDSFADSQPAFRRSRARISPARRRVGGIMVDMFYDHFLARHWHAFHALQLEDYNAGLYRLLAEHEAVLPAAFRTILPRMRAEDWLSAYRSETVIARAIDRMALRLRPGNALSGGGHELRRDYAGFEHDFFEFMEEAERFATRWRAGEVGDPGTPP